MDKRTAPPEFKVLGCYFFLFDYSLTPLIFILTFKLQAKLTVNNSRLNFVTGSIIYHRQCKQNINDNKGTMMKKEKTGKTDAPTTYCQWLY